MSKAFSDGMAVNCIDYCMVDVASSRQAPPKPLLICQISHGCHCSMTVQVVQYVISKIRDGFFVVCRVWL